MRITVLLLILSLSACTKELDFPATKEDTQVVLNGLLHPDSVVRISLSRTQPLTSKHNFALISNATVTLYEDSRPVGTLEWYDDSLYRLDYYPQAGKRYTVEAEVPDYGVVRASDIIPTRPVVDICFREDLEGRYQYSSAILDISIDDPIQEANFYWFYATSTFLDGIRCRVIKDSVICEDDAPPTFRKSRVESYDSFSPVPDRFNSYVNNLAGGVITYDSYIRIDDATLNGEVIMLDIGDFSYTNLTRYRDIHAQFAKTLHFISGSAAYDQYLKSSIIYYRTFEYGGEDDPPSPFAEPIRIYSNIENGTGIFAAYNSSSLEIGDYPCP